jgi:hypothetical protein
VGHLLTVTALASKPSVHHERAVFDHVIVPPGHAIIPCRLNDRPADRYGDRSSHRSRTVMPTVPPPPSLTVSSEIGRPPDRPTAAFTDRLATVTTTITVRHGPSENHDSADPWCVCSPSSPPSAHHHPDLPETTGKAILRRSSGSSW